MCTHVISVFINFLVIVAFGPREVGDPAAVLRAGRPPGGARALPDARRGLGRAGHGAARRVPWGGEPWTGES